MTVWQLKAVGVLYTQGWRLLEVECKKEQPIVCMSNSDGDILKIKADGTKSVITNDAWEGHASAM